jgi:hypothetical protein
VLFSIRRRPFRRRSMPERLQGLVVQHCNDDGVAHAEALSSTVRVGAQEFACQSRSLASAET